MDASNTALKVLDTDLGTGVRFNCSPTALQCIPLQAAGWCWCSLRNSFPAFLSSMSCLPGQKINWVVSKFWVRSFITLDTARSHSWVENIRIELFDWQKKCLERSITLNIYPDFNTHIWPITPIHIFSWIRSSKSGRGGPCSQWEDVSRVWCMCVTFIKVSLGALGYISNTTK